MCKLPCFRCSMTFTLPSPSHNPRTINTKPVRGLFRLSIACIFTFHISGPSDAMRVLDTHTGRFVDKDPVDTEYAILSHTWDSEGEQTYKQLRKIQKRYHPGLQPQRIPSTCLSNPSSTASGDCVAPPSVSTPDASPAIQSEALLGPI